MSLRSQRRLYGLVLKLHPADFRRRFAREMILDFEDALHTFGVTTLWRDLLLSLVRQWSQRALSHAPNPASAPRPSLLAGNYIMIGAETLTATDLARGLLSSTAVLLLCTLGLGSVRSARTAFLDPPAATPISSLSPTPSTIPETPQPLTTDSSPGFALPQYAAAAFAQAAPTPPSTGAIAAPCTAPPESADTQPHPELLLLHTTGPLPSYEVATIKPRDPDASNLVKLPPGASLNPLSLRRYIMDAFGATYSAQIIGGPDWLNKDGYTIHGKIPDDLQARINAMSSDDARRQTRLMAQCLLADRFHLKAHFETRILPVNELVPAKTGLKLTEVPAPPDRKAGDPPPPPPHPGSPLNPGTMLTNMKGNGLRVSSARAIKLDLLARVIAPETGERPIVNHTGFNGYFDLTDLTWAPLPEATAENPPDAPSLTGALEQTLGLRLVPTKAPIEVLVIDSIDHPSPN